MGGGGIVGSLPSPGAVGRLRRRRRQRRSRRQAAPRRRCMDSDHRGGGPTIPPQQCGLGKEHDDSSIIIPRSATCLWRAGGGLFARAHARDESFCGILFSIGTAEHDERLWWVGKKAPQDLSVPPTAFPPKRRREVAEPQKLTLFLFFGEIDRCRMHHNSILRAIRYPPNQSPRQLNRYTKTHNGESLPQSR